jgi:broad specificity phosphatase PhoE
VLTTIEQRHHGQRVILVVHGGIIENAMKMLAHLAPAKRLGLLTENCSMTEIEFDGERRRLLRYNDRVPLAAR